METTTPQKIVSEYISARSQDFCDLQKLRKQGWANPEGDRIFDNLRHRADNPSRKQKEKFYHMTINVGKEMQRFTGVFRVLGTSNDPAALDLGMAPGGFSSTILTHYPFARVKAITLPHNDGGHEVQLRHKQLELESKDINSLVRDLDVNISESHLKAGNFATNKIFSQRESFDVIICGAQVTRNQEREEWRERREPRLLELAQIILSMKLLRPQGSLVLVLHKPESFRTAETLQKFSTFSDIMLFKPTKAHATRSSFYLMAKNVDKFSASAATFVAACREEWRVATTGNDDKYTRSVRKGSNDAERLLESFGEKLIGLGNPIWHIQTKALREAAFVNSTS